MNNQPGQTNPLLEYAQATDGRFVPFDVITGEQVLPALEVGLAEARANIAAIAATKNPTIDTVIVALEHAQRTVGRIKLVFINLKEAHTTPDIALLSETVMGQLAAFNNELYLHGGLFAQVQKVKQYYDEHPDQLQELSIETARLLERTYLLFVRQGALLTPEQKVTLQSLDQDIARLNTQFSTQLQHAINNFRYVVRDEKQLAGLPEHSIVAAKEEAMRQDMPEAWVFTLHAPSIAPVLKYADDVEMRKALWMAKNKKGMGPGNMSDNRPVIRALVHARHKRALLLGYKSHAEYVLSDRMAKTVEQVQAMQERLSTKAKPQAIQELAIIAAAKGAPLEQWDTAYYAEKVRKERIDFSDEALRPYFAQQTVFDGMFLVLQKMYGVVATKNTTATVYHSDVFAYDFADADGRYLGTVYFDLYPRETKQQGGWIEILQMPSSIQRGHMLIVCNLSRPSAGTEALFSHLDVKILFHEMGHATHWLFSEVSYESLGGINVLMDFCELPSQFFDKYSGDASVLQLFAKHYQTGEIIPQELCDKITKQNTFMNARNMVGQIMFSVTDIAWHDGRGEQATHHKDDESVELFEKEILAPYQLLPWVDGTSHSTAFKHIFGGEYDVGYYSYHWAEVLAADAFAFFQEKGLFDQATAHAFREHILSKGNTEDPMVLYKRFRGQEPDADALLRAEGIV